MANWGYIFKRKVLVSDLRDPAPENKICIGSIVANLFHEKREFIKMYPEEHWSLKRFQEYWDIDTETETLEQEY